MLTKCGIKCTYITDWCSKAAKFAFEEKYLPLLVPGIQNDGYLECFLIQKRYQSRLERILELWKPKQFPIVCQQSS
jgi:hypothetical protein